PSAMPFCFIFPPRVAGTDSPMRPLVDSVLSAFCGHCTVANTAFAREARQCFSPFSFNESELHLLSPQSQSALDRLLDSDWLRVWAGVKKVFAGSCFSQRWPEELCRWFVNGGCCVALNSNYP